MCNHYPWCTQQGHANICGLATHTLQGDCGHPLSTPLPHTHGVDGMHPCTYSFVLCADDMNISFPVHTHLSHTHSGFAHTHAIVVVKAWANRRKKHTQHSPVMQSCCFRHNTAPSTPLVNTLCGVLVIGMLCVHVSVGVCVPLACLACTTLCCVCLHTLISPCQHTN